MTAPKIVKFTWPLVTTALVVLNALGGCTHGVAPPAELDTKRIVAADGEPGNWLTHGRTYSEQRFSPLAAINTNNVGTLGLAWSYDLEMNRGAEATPLVVDGVMYVTSAWSIVHAIDAKTGTKLWVHDPRVSREVGPKACCDAVNRGVALYGGKVFVGALDGRLLALDAKTGAVAWEVVTVDQTQAYTITGAPRVANGLVYIGNGGAEYGVRGYVSAYDAQTGAMKWRFYTVPGNPAKGPDGVASDPVMARAAATWKGEWWAGGGGGTVWDAIVYDQEFDQLLVGVGNGSPWNQQIRSPGGGDNLFLSSIVALDSKTGAYKWHYQTTPGETWDYTATQPIILADLTIDGRPRKVAMQAPKNGFFYVIDRTDGRLISASPFLEMLPAKDTPKGAPVAWAYAVDKTTGRPVENSEARYMNGVALIHPNPDGGHNWHPMSYSPQTGLVYFPIQDMPIDYATDPAFVRREGFGNLGVVISTFPDDRQARKAISNAFTAALLAWDPVSQKEIWRAKRRGPYNGGTLAVAGGLVFQGTGNVARDTAAASTTRRDTAVVDTTTRRDTAAAMPTAPAAAVVELAVADAPSGAYVTDATGRTVYVVETPDGGAVDCVGPCAAEFDPIIGKANVAVGTAGIDASLLGTRPLLDGRQQVTYDGKPLYFSRADMAKGDTKGQGTKSYGNARLLTPKK